LLDEIEEGGEGFGDADVDVGGINKFAWRVVQVEDYETTGNLEGVNLGGDVGGGW